MGKRIDKFEQNLAINGGLDLWQRGTGATQVSSAVEYLAADRFHTNRQTSAANPGALNMTRQLDVPSPIEAGYDFQYSMRLRVNQVRTTLDPQFHTKGYFVEGHDIRIASRKKVLVSFWAKSNKL